MKYLVAGFVVVLLVAAVSMWMCWPLPAPRAGHSGTLQALAVTVGGSGRDGVALIVFADHYQALVGLGQLQTRSWVIGEVYTLGVQNGRWPRGPKYWLVQQKVAPPAPAPK